MNSRDIHIGCMYRNRGKGRTRRLVLQISDRVKPGRWYGSGSPPNEPGVKFTQFKRNGEMQFTGSLYLSSFAAWAGSEEETTDSEDENPQE